MATIDVLKSKYGVNHNDAVLGGYKRWNVKVEFSGTSVENVRAKDSAEAERIAKRNIVDRCSGVTGNTKVSIKRMQTEEA